MDRGAWWAAVQGSQRVGHDFAIKQHNRLPRWLSGKDPPDNGGDEGHLGSILGSGRSPGVGNGNTLQYSCLGNAMDRGAWQATVHRVAKSQTWLTDWSIQAYIGNSGGGDPCVSGKKDMGANHWECTTSQVSWHLPPTLSRYTFF